MEILMRAWDNKYKYMDYIDDFYWFEEQGVHDSKGSGHHSNYKFMLYVGLFDDTGKRIYDKDIVEVTTSGGRKYRSEVFMHPFGVYIEVKSPISGSYEAVRLHQYCDYGVGEGILERCLIIGNKYENPEFLKEIKLAEK